MQRPPSDRKGPDQPTGKENAQRRVDRIRAFREEVRALDREGVLVLPEEQQRRVSRYHDGLLRELAGSFDVDTSVAQKQLTLGLRIISFLGAAAISAAVFFFFYRFWGVLSTSAQVAVLVTAPVIATLGVELAARREKTLYFASLAGLVAFACFVLDLSMLGQVFSITPSQNAFLIWAVFAFLLAYTYGIRLLQVAGIIALSGWLAATAGTWAGCYWLGFGERPENFILSGLALFGISFIPHGRHEEFPPYYRIFGLLQVFIAVLILGDWGRVSYLALPAKTVEHLYQLIGFLSAGLVIWLGIRRHWPGVTNMGSTFFTIFLYTKFYDWWWEWMPRYLFFLVVGLVAVLLLLVLKRLRAASREGAP